MDRRSGEENTNKRLNYSQARPLVKTGDCLSIATKSNVSVLVRLGQRFAKLSYPNVTHTAVARWLEDRLFAVEMISAGNVYRPLSQYIKQGCDVLVCQPPEEADMEQFVQALQHATETYIPYGFTDLTHIGLRLLAGRWIDTSQWGKDSGEDQVCSFFVGNLYMRLGTKMSIMPNMPSPAEVAMALPLKFWINGQDERPVAKK